MEIRELDKRTKASSFNVQINDQNSNTIHSSSPGNATGKKQGTAGCTMFTNKAKSCTIYFQESQAVIFINLNDKISIKTFTIATHTVGRYPKLAITFG